jgi:magnesium-transporting ATPase (P-type)
MLVGATAIEDKLQDGVPEAIATLLSVRVPPALFVAVN